MSPRLLIAVFVVVPAAVSAALAIHALRAGARYDRDLPDWHQDVHITDPGGHCRIVYRGTPR